MDVTLQVWLIAATGAFFVGLGKGGLPGIGNITVALYAMAFDPKESVGILLPVLICADVIAVTVYRRHAHWGYMRRLLPWTAAGIIVGFLVMDQINARAVEIVIGVTLLGITAIHFYRKRQLAKLADGAEDPVPHTLWFRAGTGIAGGFATMVANAAGPVAALYFLAVGLPKLAFIGTAAWFFFIVNVFKVPFHWTLGLITPDSLLVSLSVAPAAGAGAFVAPFIVKRINQKWFEGLVWFFIVVAGFKLLV